MNPSSSSSSSSSSLTGLFHTEEKCIVFLDIVQELMNSTLMDAYRSAANLKFHEVPSVLHFSPYIAERFRYALDLIPNWPYQILQQEEERALQRCSAIYECYRYLVEVYAKEISLGGAGAISVNPPTQNLPLPPLPAFLHDIYNEFICIPEVRNGVYFQMYGIHRKSTIADAIRSALRKLISKLPLDASAGNFPHDPPVAAAPYLSPGPSISQRAGGIPPQLPPPPQYLPSRPPPKQPFPDFPSTPKTQTQTAAPKPPPQLPPTPATTTKTPFQRAIEIDMNAVPTTPSNVNANAEDSEGSDD